MTTENSKCQTKDPYQLAFFNRKDRVFLTNVQSNKVVNFTIDSPIAQTTRFRDQTPTPTHTHHKQISHTPNSAEKNTEKDKKMKMNHVSSASTQQTTKKKKKTLQLNKRIQHLHEGIVFEVLQIVRAGTEEGMF